MRLLSCFPAILSLTLLTIHLSTINVFCWSLTKLILNENINDEYYSGDVSQGINKFKFLPPENNKDFFESIDDLSICRKKEVRKFIFQYMTFGRKFLHAAITRSFTYQKTIKKIFNKNSNIPSELALLPLLESAFNPYAVSRSNAVGLWQFILGTSRALGLKTNNWVDERRDVEKSTEAAIRHLKGLYSIFNSWELALAAYNGGAGHVKKSMLKSGSKTFQELHRSKVLKKETNEYVLRFAALSVMYNNQELFGLKETITPSNALETETFKLDFPVKIGQVSKLSGISIKTLRKCNPELKKNITPPYATGYNLRLPSGAVEKLEKYKSKLYKISFKKLKKHIVRKGECISKIAKRYKTKIKKILMLNNIKKPHLIRPGLKLYIPI